MKKMNMGIVGASSLLAKELLVWINKWHVPYGQIHLFDTQEHCGYMMPFETEFLVIKKINQQLQEPIDILFICKQDIYPTTWDTTNIYRVYLDGSCEQANMFLPRINMGDMKKEDMICFIPGAASFMLAHMSDVMKQIDDMDAIVATSMHSAGECGCAGCEELQKQIEAYSKDKEMEAACFPLPSSYQNLPLFLQVLPQTSAFLSDGRTMEEAALQEIIHTLYKKDIPVHATCVRGAWMRGMSMSATFQWKQKHSIDTIMDAFTSAPSFICFDDLRHDMYPIMADVIHDYRIFIGRMRLTSENACSVWAVCDDLSCRCAAAIQIALHIYHNYL